MTQEDKDLLLKDLCSRLPYGVKMKKNYENSYGTDDTPVELCGLDVDKNIVNICKFRGKSITVCDNEIPLFIAMVKSRYLPYLFPLSSMTEEQRKEYERILTVTRIMLSDWTIEKTFNNEYIIPHWFVDFCNKYHFDYLELIPKGLALDATGKNIY